MRLRPCPSPRTAWTCLGCWTRQQGQGLLAAPGPCWLLCWTTSKTGPASTPCRTPSTLWTSCSGSTMGTLPTSHWMVRPGQAPSGMCPLGGQGRSPHRLVLFPWPELAALMQHLGVGGTAARHWDHSDDHHHHHLRKRAHLAPLNSSISVWDTVSSPGAIVLGMGGSPGLLQS